MMRRGADKSEGRGSRLSATSVRLIVDQDAGQRDGVAPRGEGVGGRHPGMFRQSFGLLTGMGFSPEPQASCRVKHR
jgi:hypothetical protein